MLFYGVMPLAIISKDSWPEPFILLLLYFSSFVLMLPLKQYVSVHDKETIIVFHSSAVVHAVWSSIAASLGHTVPVQN